MDMKKSKMAAKSSVKKVSKNKKPILLKKAKKLHVKMGTKSKKPQVKVPAKSAIKSAVKAVVKTVAKITQKSAPKNLKTKSLPVKAPKSAPVSSKPVKEIKKAGKAAAAVPVVAAVLTKQPVVAGKAAKLAKPAKVAKVGAHSDRMCRELACENMATTKGYCRLDYIKNWKKIKRKEMILKEGKLNQYIEELVGKYPDKYIDVIRQDLSTEVNFNKVIHDLELDESIDDLDYDGDSIDALIGGIKKEIEDFGDEEF
jgi:uncharacterized protein YihD (DUF1040 family)